MTRGEAQRLVRVVVGTAPVVAPFATLVWDQPVSDAVTTAPVGAVLFGAVAWSVGWVERL